MRNKRHPCLRLALSVVLWAAGCGVNTPPDLLQVAPQVGYVGSKIELTLVANDPDADSLTFTFSCPTANLNDRARMFHLSGKAIFSWTPLASDVGIHQIGFTVFDGALTDTETTTFTIRPSTNDSTSPMFRKPLGEGVTLDLSTKKCLQIEILVQDPDSVSVSIGQSPAIPGSNLKKLGPMRAQFSWCPSSSQMNKSIYTLKLVANDHDNPPVQKDFTILLRSELPQNCPGASPKISHTPPAPQTTSGAILLKATVTDDKGLKGVPVVYYSATKPSNPAKLNYSTMSQLAMSASGGSSQFQANIPNPTSGLAAGQSADLYYVIVAEDDDDKKGACDHRTQLPAASVFKVKVTRPISSVACTTSAQCASGQVCDNKVCVSDSCVPKDTNGDLFFHEQSSCPSLHFCPVKGPGTTPSHCALKCTADSDCTAPGAVCKVFDTASGCGKPGSKNTGRECADFTDCNGIAMCLPWSNGYCAISDCDSSGLFSGACPAGSACIPLPDLRFSVLKTHWLCLQLCQDNSNCRTGDGYTCKTHSDDQFNPRKVCLE